MPRVVSPVAEGSGSILVHRQLENHIPDYRIKSYSPLFEFIPFALPVISSIHSAEIIHTPPDHAVFFFKKAIPLIITFHNYVLDRFMRPYSSRLQRLHYRTDLLFWTRMAVKRAHGLTAVSRFTASLVQREMAVSQPIRVIYNGIDTGNFVPPSQNRRQTSNIRVFFSGNLTRRKGAQWLPAIAERLNKGVEIHYTLGLRKQRPLNPSGKLRSLGCVQYGSMPGLYRSMDMLLMPTVREGFGLSVVEAMSCGLPVVASDCSAIPELVDHGKGGFLCSVGDVDAFADKINQLADSPRLRKEMGAYNRAKAERMFTVERMVREYKELFDEVLG